ncbi:MAG: MFS transporter [Bacillota bacterium]
MATFFLMIIYMAFISLGLPDSLLGVAWPLMQSDYGAPFEAAGLVSMFIAGGTIVSSLASGAVHKRLSTGKVTFVSCLMTAVSLLGFSFSPSLIWLLFLAIPLGLGAGSVDAALNNYVASHYKAHHMSWLHCFWGVGATLGPIIMSQFIARQNSWRNGYAAVSAIQFSLVALLFFTLPMWNRMAKEVHNSPDHLNEAYKDTNTIKPPEAEKKLNPLQIKGVKLALVSFLFYCGVEATMGLWGSSFLVGIKGLPTAVAAQWVSMYYAGITVGRLITGFITLKVSNRILIRMGQATALAGAVLVLMPLTTIFSLIGFIMVGLGCAPIFPCMLHETPARFGKENSQTIMGYQMALAYTGSTFLPPILGIMAAQTTIGLFPFFVLACITIMLIGSERINALMKVKKAYGHIPI